MDPETELIRVGASQYAVFTIGQAVSVGVSRRTVERRVRTGLLRRLHSGVFVPSTTFIGWEQVVMAACLACEPGGVASHASAAAIWGLATAVDVPHVTVSGTTRRHRGVVIHKTDRLERVTKADFPVTPPMRTLLDLSAEASEERLEIALDVAHRRGLIEMSRFGRYLDLEPHRVLPGSGVLREMVRLRRGHRPKGSDLETLFFRALRDLGLPLPVSQYPVETKNGLRYIDFAYPDRKLAIELDGFEEHGGKRAVFDDDHVREIDLRELGFDLRRLTWPMVRQDPVGSGVTVGRALGLKPCRWKKA